MEQSEIIEELVKEAKAKQEGEIYRSKIDELKDFISFLPNTASVSIHPPNLLCRMRKYDDISVQHIEDKFSDVILLKQL